MEKEGEGEIPLLIKHPSSFDHRVAESIYERSLKQAQAEGLPTQEEMEKIISERGIFGQKQIDEIEDIKKKIKAQKLVLSKTTRVPARRDRLKTIIKELEEEAALILLKKDRFLEQTRERKALEQKHLYLTWKATYNVYTEDLYWKSYEDFAAERDFLFRKRVYVEYALMHYGLTQEVVRSIARSSLWRIRYVGALKLGESLFGRPISEYTTDQTSLLYWSQFYQSVYEMMPDERPSDEIIEDDEALDAYMNDWYDERNRDNAASKAKKGNYGKSSAWDHQETLVTRANPMFKDIKYSETLAEKAKNKGKTVVDAAPMNRKKD